jgi:hypothetical protein
MDPTFVAYIDESGDEGFSFAKGSPEWFILSAVVTRKASDLATVKLVDKVRTILGKPPKKPLHFRDLKHEQRLPLVAEIAKADLRVAALLVHKPSLHSPETFRKRYLLYFYACRYLFERVSWYCRDHRGDGGDGSVCIVFSNRSGMAYEELGEYLERLRTMGGDIQIDWSVVRRDQIWAMTPGRGMGLQIADAVAGSFYYAVQPSSAGFTEDRYARMLRPVVYSRQGRFEGYGLKFWPSLSQDLMSGDRFSWLREVYQE